MIRDDRGISELMGYTVLVAVVSIASAALLAGSMGTLSASEKQLEYSGSAASLTSFGNIVSGIVEANNTFDTAYGMSVPRGCDLIVSDRHDDFRSLGIYSDSTRLAFLPMGSAAISSTFRSVAFEGGAVISNDTGLVTSEARPHVYVAGLPSGKKALYMYITSISSEMPVMHSGTVTLYARCVSVKPLSWHLSDGSTLVLWVRSGGLQAWQEVFEACGLSTSYENGALKASATDVSDVYVVYAEAGIHV